MGNTLNSLGARIGQEESKTMNSLFSGVGAKVIAVFAIILNRNFFGTNLIVATTLLNGRMSQASVAKTGVCYWAYYLGIL